MKITYFDCNRFLELSTIWNFMRKGFRVRLKVNLIPVTTCYIAVTK